MQWPPHPIHSRVLEPRQRVNFIAARIGIGHGLKHTVPSPIFGRIHGPLGTPFHKGLNIVGLL